MNLTDPYNIDFAPITINHVLHGFISHLVEGHNFHEPSDYQTYAIEIYTVDSFIFRNEPYLLKFYIGWLYTASKVTTFIDLHVRKVKLSSKLNWNMKLKLKNI